MGKLNDAMTTASPQSSAGLTLLGVLVAALLFASILTASFGLVARSTREVGRGRENFVATNLAREGLELVQVVRDSNMLQCPPGQANPACPATSAWTGNLAGGAPLCADDGEQQLIVDRNDPIPGGARVQAWQGSNDQLWLEGQRYQHDATGAATAYHRRVTIDCANRAAAADEHIVITSTVTWQSRGEDHAIALRGQLYNWYQ